MIIKYSYEFLEKLKNLNVRIKKNFQECIILFERNPNDPQLRNHPLKRDYKDYRSINITNNYRALYQEKQEGEDVVIYFSLLGTHKELYR